MNAELLTVLDQIERERGISKAELIEALEASLLSASSKGVGPSRNLTVKIDPETGDITAWSEPLVVEKVQDPKEEIGLREARKVDKAAKVGEPIRIVIPPERLGRIAASHAKNAIMQKIKDREREIIYNEYKDRVGQLVTGAVRRYEHRNVFLDMGRAEAVLPVREQSPGERYPQGGRVRAMILSVDLSAKGPEIVVTRSRPEFVRKLFEMEVPEVADETVEIKALAREPGFRTKAAVYSRNEKVDCVGACVGMRGARVKNIIRELNGERIDIIRWHKDLKTLIAEALSPARIKEIRLNEKETSALVVVNDDQLALAVGRRGFNTRLTSNLTGWKVDIIKESELLAQEEESLEDKLEAAAKSLEVLPGVGAVMAKQLVEAGFITLNGVLTAGVEDLTQVPGVGKEMARKMREAARSILSGKGLPGSGDKTEEGGNGKGAER